MTLHVKANKNANAFIVFQSTTNISGLATISA